MEEVYIKTFTLPEWLVRKHLRMKDFISVEELIEIIEDLDGEVELLKEELDDLKQNINDNYKFVGTREAVGYNEDW